MCKVYFLLGLFAFIPVGFEGNNKYAKKVLSQPWNSLTLQLSLSLGEKHVEIVFTLQGYLGRSDSLSLGGALRDIQKTATKETNNVTDSVFFIL